MPITVDTNAAETALHDALVLRFGTANVHRRRLDDSVQIRLDRSRSIAPEATAAASAELSTDP